MTGYNVNMTTFDRISIDPATLDGQPCIRGTRITVRRVVLALAHNPHWADLKLDYPALEDQDIRQALQYAAESVEDEVEHPVGP